MKQTIKSLQYRSLILINLLRQGSYLKAWNYLLTSYSMIIKPDIAPNYPSILVVEPGNICNLRCALCATGQRDTGRPNTLLKFENFKILLDQVGKYVVNLDLLNWGEPFLNKEIFEMIRYARKYKIYTVISSNLNLYNGNMGKNIITSGLDMLILSIHGGSPETYSKYMKGGNFEKVTQNLKNLIALKKQMSSKKPVLRWRFVVFRHNQHEVEKTRKLALEMGVDEFEALPMKIDIGYDVATVKRGIHEKKSWIPTIDEYNLYDITKNVRKDKDLDCLWPWEMISIGANGAVQPCCVFYNKKFDFGNIFSEPFLSVWNNHFYQASRKMLRKKTADNSTICGPCMASGFLAR